jgi:hypothetical protein
MLMRRLLLMIVVVIPIMALLVGGIDLVVRQEPDATLARKFEAALAILLMYGLIGAIGLSVLHTVISKARRVDKIGPSAALALLLGAIIGAVTSLALLPPFRLYAVLWGAVAGGLYALVVSGVESWRGRE